jgi:hypothetical protein
MSHLIGESTAYVRPSRAEALHAAWLLTGVMRVIVTELESAAADVDDDAVSAAVHSVRQDVDWLGTMLVHERHTEEVAPL